MQTQKITRTLHLKADPATVWHTLTDPERTKLFMFNCRVDSDWQPGSPIRWSGNYQGYESAEQGTILECEKEHRLKYTSFDPSFGLADKEENYLHITYQLNGQGQETELITTIENFNGDPVRMEHIAKGWDGIVLPALEKVF